MKITILLGIGIIIFNLSYSQNIQLHYDFGEGRKHLTSTVELFKPDKLGSTFFFIDMDYNAGDVEGISSAYWELARAFKINKTGWAAHIEYNGGFGRWQDGDFSGSFGINHAYLAGLEYSMNADDFSKGITFMSLYKYIDGFEDASFQFTAAWYQHMFNKKLTFKGFADFWKQESLYADLESSSFVFLSEPQLWYHLNQSFSVGGEVELSNNFGGVQGFKVRPTLGIKYKIN